MKEEPTGPSAARDILFIATDLSTGGGVNKVIRDLARLFSQRLRASVKVVSARSSAEPSYEFPVDVKIEYHTKQALPSYFALLFRLRRSRPRIVIGPWTQDNILIVLAFLFSRTKVVAVEHASWRFHGPFVRLVRRLIYPLAWRVVVLNPAELAHYGRYLRNVRLMPNPVESFPPIPAVPREKLILAVGHLHRLKNFEDAIRAMAISGLEDNGWSLVIIGQGEDERRLRRLIDELGLRQTAIQAPTPDIPTWYARSSLLLVTSRMEVFSLVLAEALQSGVVPIAYAADGPSFILEDFPDQLIEVGDVDALARRLREFAGRADLEDLRNRLRTAVKGRFDPERIAEQWRELLS